MIKYLFSIFFDLCITYLCDSNQYYLSVFKKLASEAALYGLSSILARLVNFILVPIHTGVFKERADYGVIGQLFGWIAVGVTLYTMRLESAYFRYASNDENSRSYANSKIVTLLITIILSASVLFFADPLAQWLQIGGYGYLVKYAALIISFDALAELPFAKLRLQKKPVKFVTIKITGILINVVLNVYFLLLAPHLNTPAPEDKIAAVFLANLMASVFTFLLLNKEYLAEGFEWNKKEITKVLQYAWPLLIVGLAGNFNDAMTRQFIGWFANGTAEVKKTMMGEYNACVKFGVFIMLFVQAFRYAAEPFFFKHMHHSEAKSDYSKITTYFTQFLMIGFVGVMVYLDFIQPIVVRTPSYLNGIGIVPLVLMANVINGIYYNVSNWYRLTDKTEYGMYSALIGVAVTVISNYILVPLYGYYGTAMAMILCYFTMTLITYLWGQKYFAVNYEWRKMIVVMAGGILTFLLYTFIRDYIHPGYLLKFVLSSFFFIVYLFVFNYSLLRSVIKK